LLNNHPFVNGAFILNKSVLKTLGCVKPVNLALFDTWFNVANLNCNELQLTKDKNIIVNIQAFFISILL